MNGLMGFYTNEAKTETYYIAPDGRVWHVESLERWIGSPRIIDDLEDEDSLLMAEPDKAKQTEWLEAIVHRYIEQLRRIANRPDAQT